MGEGQIGVKVKAIDEHHCALQHWQTDTDNKAVRTANRK